MKSKKIFCLVLCLSILFTITACGDEGEPVSSNVSTTLSTTDSSSSDQQTSSTNDDTSSGSTQSREDVLEMLYGFKSIKRVDYNCVKNLEGSDTIYSIYAIITDHDEDILTDPGISITTADENVKIDGSTITIPASYTESGKSVKFTVEHSQVDVKYDFNIEPASSWNLVFEDNFDGTELNTDVWGEIWDTSLTFEQRDPFFFGYKKEMAFLDGEGNLVNRVYATGEFADDGRPLYKSSLIATKDCYESTYGYYEIRMRPHLANSIKGSFWLMAGDMGDHDAVNDGSSENGCEVDIIETMSNLNYSGCALHWDGYYNGQTKSEVYGEIYTPEIFDGNYHTFAVCWTPEEFVFLIDGKVTIKSDAAGGCHVPAYMLISSHVGTWGGDITLKAGEHSDMLVDYVKVYSSNY